MGSRTHPLFSYPSGEIANHNLIFSKFSVPYPENQSDTHSPLKLKEEVIPMPCNHTPQSAVEMPCDPIPPLVPEEHEFRESDFSSIFEDSISIPQPSSPFPKSEITQEPFRHTKARFEARERLMNEEKMKSVLRSKKKNENSQSQFAAPSKQTIRMYEEELKLCEAETFEPNNYTEEIEWQKNVLGSAHPKYAV